jgi:membrane-bound ClpP family serine protease
MKNISIVCAVLLLIGIADLPIGYYTLLRIAVTIGAVVIIVSEYEKGLNGWVILFGLIAIIFNPLMPVYLHSKDAWMPIDLITAVLFIVKAFNSNKKRYA